MIIEQIKLSNWLSYPDKWKKNGQLDTPCLQFNQGEVYLIFGKNGAGKSGIMEAILFALFGDYSRASDRQDIKRGSAIRTGEKTATVELVFNLNGQRHKVQRILQESKSKERITSVAQYSCWDTEKQDWGPGLSQVRVVNDKIISLLGMKQDLFCGTVILEQGKTGRFMELKPGDQVDHVMNLLGLKIYNLYYDRAKKLANQRKSKVADIETELKPLSDTSDEKVENANNQLQISSDSLEQIEGDILSLERLRTQVEEIEKLRRRLDQVARNVAKSGRRLINKDKIEAADQIVQVWGQAEAQLREVQQALKQYSECQRRVQKFQDELEQKQLELSNGQRNLDDELGPAHEREKDALKETKGYLTTRRNQYANAQRQRDIIAAELDLDRRENEIQIQQRERQRHLKQLPQVKDNYHLWTELNRVVPELKTIVTDLQESAETTAYIADSDQVLQDGLDDLEERREQLVQFIEQQKILEAKTDAAQESEARIRRELETNKVLLAKREKAHGESECPTCGTPLEGKELDRFHRELVELRDKVEIGKGSLAAAHQNAIRLEQERKTHEGQRRQEENAIEREDGRLATEQSNLKTRKVRAEDQARKAREQWQTLKDSLNYAAEIITDPVEECLNLARMRCKAIDNIQEIYDKLQQSQASFETAQEELERIQRKRQHPSGTFNETQLSDAENACGELDEAVKQSEGELKQAEGKERKLYEQLTNAKNNLQALRQRTLEIQQTLLPREQRLLAQSENNRREAVNRFEELLSGLSWPTQQLEMLRQAANSDQQAQQTINAWIEKHRPLAAQLPELKKAEREIGNLRSKHTTLDDQIKGFPDEVQKAQSKVIEGELETKQREQTDQKEERNQWQRTAWEEAQRLERKQALEKNHEHLVIEEGDFRTLAALLEPPGPRSAGGPLLQEIMRGSLQKVAVIASDILSDWNQSTEIIVSKDSLEFKVIDRACGTSERYYQLFSGGEKFMVSLAMALAIGEVASDTGHTDCLFIDEGFGLLDVDNRAVVAQEIVNKLVGSSRRKQVIVITHMEDLKGAFSKRSRYHLVNDGNATQLSTGENDAHT